MPARTRCAQGCSSARAYKSLSLIHIYYRDLRAELEAQGWQFQTNSDTEVLLTGYLAWGEGVLDRLRGMFAFAIWDRDSREL